MNISKHCVLCLICFKTFKGLKYLSQHIKKDHEMISKEYFDLFLKCSYNNGKCLCCGKSTKFISLSAGYKSSCCSSCKPIAIKQHMKLKHGVENPFQLPYVIEKIQAKVKPQRKNIKIQLIK